MIEKGTLTEEKWRKAVKICERILADRATFENEEINYKLEISKRVRALSEALEKEEDFVSLLKRAFSAPNNLTSWRSHNLFIEWANNHQNEARKAMLDLMDHRKHSVENRVNRFLSVVPADKPSGFGSRLSITSFLLMGSNPKNHPMYRTTDYATVERLLGWEVPEGITPGEAYRRHRSFVNVFLDRLRKAKLDIRDYLDVQSLIWILANRNDPDIRAWRGETKVPTALERAMDEFEHDLDPETLERHRMRFAEAKVRFDELFGSEETIEQLTPASFFEFFNSIDAHGKPEAGLFTPNLPFPKNPETQAYRRLVEYMPALRQALTELLYGEGGLAERTDRMHSGPGVRTYITESLPIPSMLLCFQDPESHAGVQQMGVKKAKIAAAGGGKDSFEDEGLTAGQLFQLMEEILATFPSDHGRDWDWAQRNLFYFSESFRRNLEEDPLADYVDRFYAERGYPTARDKEDLEAREEFASYISEDALLDFNWANFQYLFSSRKYGSTGPMAGLNRYINQADEACLDKLIRSINHLLYSNSSLTSRMENLLDGEYKVKNFGESVATKLLSIRYPERILPIFTAGGDKGKIALMRHEALRLETPKTNSRGERAVLTNDLLGERLAPYFGDDTHGMKEFLYWLYWLEEESVDETAKSDALGDLADSLLIDKAFLQEVIWLLREKGQVIFYGPPGTGKTFVARAIAKHLAAELSRREVVQFHPSYSYEDFVQGYRPMQREDGSLTYKLKHGPLMRLAYAATEAEGRDHVLLIDEINRGNLPKILGELLYLLEYRDDEVALLYGEDGERFSLPGNLFVIGTMNTADRSIALVDAALRRRFHFIPFFPEEYPLNGLLLRWLEENNQDMLDVAGIVARLNSRLREQFGPHLQVGPSYFMRRDLSHEVLKSIWAHDIMPFLEDQLFGHEEELANYTLDSLRGEGSADDRAEGVPTDPGTPDA